ncbi:DUF2523 domain-containing protein [Chitinibacter fontanus]|uniref:DUF2523 domain-containing protein n=1 Tax=Chitinibacter fontanus TaxID=1737446 RepID=A0A7D5Z6Q4_9NEIS|nr:DUF2523 family protein [Chitinibacter fontanus]QLI83021.1 DUF2523 domain-containing protein [Chitinibacter fontanus]
MADFFQMMYDWATSGVWSWAEQSIFYLLAKASIWWIELKTKTLVIAMSMAYQAISDLGISAMLNRAFGSVDSSVLGLMTYLKVPEGVNMLMSAALTKMMMRMVGL